mgnify:CR=1 FL=1
MCLKEKEVDLLVVNANQLITVRDFNKRPRRREEMRELGIIPSGAIAISGENIVAIGKTKDILSNYKLKSGGRLIDAQDKVVMPGFIDPHTHLIFAGSREEEFSLRLKGTPYLQILKQGGGILNTVTQTRKATNKELIELATKNLDLMLSYGTTTVEAKSGYGLNLKDEIRILEVIRFLNQNHPVDLIPTFLGAHTIPPEYRDNPDAYVNLVVEKMIPEVSRRNLAHFCDVFCEKGVFSVHQSRLILEEGKKRGLQPKLHADQMVGSGGAELAAELEAISAGHLEHISDKGIRKMAKQGVIAVLLPGASFSLRSETYAPARKMIDEGISVAISTDFNPGTCMIRAVPVIIGLACLQTKMSIEEAITASTLHAAYALNQADKIGSLEEGKQADAIILKVPSYKHLPYQFGTNLVEKVIKRGKVVIDSG